MKALLYSMLNRTKRVGVVCKRRLCHSILQRKSQKNSEPTVRNVNNNALAERFSQILENKAANSPPSLVEREPKLMEIYKRHGLNPDKQYEYTYQRELGYLRSEPLLRGNKHARDIANSAEKSWDGNESVEDTSLRMLLDLKPPLKFKKTIITPPVDVKTRLDNAKESSLDYKLDKNAVRPGKREKEEFKEMFHERLVGPKMLLEPDSTLGFSELLSQSKINASIDRTTGHFNNDEKVDNLRGKPLDRGHLQNCLNPNYFVNQILNKQEVLPPWIESQKGVDREILSFRRLMDKKWFDRLLLDLNPYQRPKDEVINKAESWQRQGHYDTNFHAKETPYVHEKVKLINKSIRDYNLQSPSASSHKFKLLPDREIKALHRRIIVHLKEGVLKWYEKEEIVKARKQDRLELNDTRGFLELFGSLRGGSMGGKDKNAEKLGIWKAIKEIFST